MSLVNDLSWIYRIVHWTNYNNWLNIHWGWGIDEYRYDALFIVVDYCLKVSCGARNDKSAEAGDSLYLVRRNISPRLLYHWLWLLSRTETGLTINKSYQLFIWFHFNSSYSYVNLYVLVHIHRQMNHMNNKNITTQ